MLDKFNRYQSDENTGLEMLYKGKSLSSTEFTTTEDVDKFNTFCDEFDINVLKKLSGVF